MTIREYLDEILKTGGCDAYEMAQEKLVDAYLADDDSFEQMCEDLGIDLEAMEYGYLVVTLWAWDLED